MDLNFTVLQNSELVGGANAVAVSLVGILALIIHIAFAYAVWRDAKLMKRSFGRGTFLVNGLIWGLATLQGGVFVAGLYWVIHHSSLRRDTPPAPSNL